MTSIVSPFIQLLQATVDKDLSILDMATDFIAAFCSMPSHYQHAKMTKHTLATFWFIFSLIYKTGKLLYFIFYVRYNSCI